MNNRLIKSNDAGGGGACTNTVDLYNPFPDGGGVALYQLNGDATDVSGNYDGTATNVTYGTGQFGQAASFQNTNSRIILPDNVDISLEQSVSIWVKPTLISYSFPIYFTKNGWGINVYIPSNGAVELQACRQANGTQITYFGSAGDIIANNWYNFVITRTSSQAAFYINSQQVATINYDGTRKANNYSNTIGNFAIDGYQERGLVDQVRVFNRALRPYEVEALYTEEYCTPTIVPSEHFNTVLYTGTGATNPVTGVGFQPDFVWLKKRSGVDDHFAFDSVRGAKSIYPNLTNAEDSFTFSFDTDGFTVPVSGGTNGNGDTFVAWNFKAGGAAVTNTDGTITSQVSANTEAGFSVVKYTGTGTSSGTIGHGLTQKPSVYILKTISSTSNWKFYYVPTNTQGFLNLTNAFEDGTSGGTNGAITSDLATDTTLGIKSGSSSANNVNSNGTDYLLYNFAEVEGFSNFGSYVGNGTTSGAKVVTGFEPAFIIIKSATGTRSWRMIDNKRSPENPATKDLRADASTAENDWEANGWGDILNFHTNGFEIIGSDTQVNANGETYIYMAFAADPTAVEPTLEDSFNTVLYTGNDTNTSYTRDITGFGFQPDFVWIKDRDNGAFEHTLFDSVRGAGSSNVLSSNTTGAEGWTSAAPMSAFIDDGFSVQPRSPWNANNLVNKNGEDFVAWAWKGAELPAINSNGSIPSVVSANPAAGFSIVSYTGNGSTGTIGHGLSSAPSMLIIKNRSLSTNWVVGSNEIGWNYSLNLNDTSAAGLSTNRFNATSPTSTVFSVGATSVSNGSGNSMIAYCFAEVAGFSKFGSYTGNGSNQYINLGFEPAFIMVKRTDNTGTWGMFDNKRGLAAPQPRLLANDSASENTGTTYWASTDSTGFTVQGSSIYGSGNFIYMAFANQF